MVSYKCPVVELQPSKVLPWKCDTCHATWVRGYTLSWHEMWRKLTLDLRAPHADVLQHIQRAKVSSERKLSAIALELRDAARNLQDSRDYYRELPKLMEEEINNVKLQLIAAGALLVLERIEEEQQ